MKINKSINEGTRPLKEKKWAVTLSSGKALRKAIHNGDYQGIIDGIVACYDEMFDNGIIDDYDHDAWIEDVLDIDITSPDVEEDINYELNNLYDACDNLDCWIALGESFKEGHSLPYTKWVKRADDGSWVMWGGSNSDKLDKDFLDRINHPNYPNKAYNIENQYLDAVVLPAGEEPVDESLSSRDETKVRILLNKRIPRSDVVEDIIDVINQFPLRTNKDKLRLAKRIRDIYPVDDWAMEQIIAYAELNKNESLNEDYTKQELIDAVQSAYGYNKKEAKDYIKTIDDKTKEELIKGFKRDAKKGFLVDSLNEAEGKDYPGSRYGYEYEPMYFIIVDEESNPVDTFEGTQTDLENYFKDNYDSSFSVKNVSASEYFDTIDLIGTEITPTVSQARFEVFDGFLDDFIDELAAELSVEGIEIIGFTAEELDQDVANLYFTSGNATTNNVLSVSVEMAHDGELDENFVNTCISNAASSTGVDWSEHVEYADVTDTL